MWLAVTGYLSPPVQQSSRQGLASAQVLFSTVGTSHGTQQYPRQTAASTCFTATLVITPSGSPEQTYTVYIATDSTPVNNQTIDCKFDIGSALPTSPTPSKSQSNGTNMISLVGSQVA